MKMTKEDLFEGQLVELTGEFNDRETGLEGTIRSLEVIDYEVVRVEIFWKSINKVDIFSIEEEPNILSKLKEIK